VFSWTAYFVSKHQTHAPMLVISDIVGTYSANRFVLGDHKWLVSSTSESIGIDKRLRVL
jgi:hypothetical protein